MATVRGLFISADNLKAGSYIEANVEDKVIEPTVIMCMDIHILPLLGSALFNDLEAQIIAATVSVLYKKLLDQYIYPCMLWYVMAEGAQANTYKFANKGLLTKTSDNASPASMSDMLKVIDNWTQKAEQYAEKLTKFLYAHPSDYPKFFDQAGEGIDRVIPATSGYETGLYLGMGDDLVQALKNKLEYPENGF